MLGGRIRGKGTYGCVFQPALKCRGKNHNVNSQMVGKITSKDSAKNEIGIAKILNQIPDASEYAILAEEETCIPRTKSKQSDKDIGQCDLINEIKIENTVQILMPWGGYPLSSINLDPFVFNYLRFFEEILACGAFLVTNDLCHFDIWGNNFLFNNQNKPRLIDFGFTFQASKLTMKDLVNRWRLLAVDHDTETPEVTLMLGTHKDIPVNYLIRGLSNEKPAVQRLQVLCEVDVEEWSSELNQWAQDSQSFQQHDWLNCWKLYWPGFDAWSIGAVLLNVLEIQMSLPAFIESKAWKEKGPLVKKILRGLCRSHPAYRIDAAEALNLFTEGKHPLISSGSAGSEWIHEKQQHRSAI
jgi:hypothetical protein